MLKDIETVPSEFRVFLSGPISAHVTHYRDVKFLFFGDRHQSLEGTCPIPCSDINLETSEYIDIPKCFDIVALLSTIYKQAEGLETYVDTYLEIPYLSPDVTEDLSKHILIKDYIPKIWVAFFNCFLKINCSPFTRFHYVNLRTIEQSRYSTPTNLDGIVRQELDILKRLPFKSLEMFKHFRRTDKIIRIIYQETRLNALLFLTILTSDNYIDWVTQLINEHLSSLSPNQRKYFIDLLTDSTIVSESNGKIQHRVRKQLYQLEREGQSELATKIREYVKNTYFQRDIQQKVKNIWEPFALSYREFSDSSSLPNDFEYFSRIITRFQKSLSAISAPIMDVYTLARMFRTFPNTNHQPSQIRIVYAGDYHISIYKDFFENWLNTSITSYVSSPPNIRCLEVDARDFLGPTLIAD